MYASLAFSGVPFSHGFRFTFTTVLGKYILPEAHRLFLFKKLSFIKTRHDPLRLYLFASLNGGLLFLWIRIPKQHPTTSELIWISPDQLLVSTVQYRTLVATVRKGCHLLKKILALLAELKYSLAQNWSSHKSWPQKSSRFCIHVFESLKFAHLPHRVRPVPRLWANSPHCPPARLARRFRRRLPRRSWPR